MKNAWLFIGVFGVGLVVNPYLGCSSDDPDFNYTEQDMQAAVLGDWEGMADIDGISVPFTLTLEQASAKTGTQRAAPPGVTPQCSSRSFVKPAAACVSTSSMPLSGVITSSHGSFDGPVVGALRAYRDLEPAELELTLEDGRELRGSLKSERIREGTIWETRQVGSFSLARP